MENSDIVTLEFSPPVKPEDKEIQGFSLCDNSGRCIFAKAIQVGSIIKVSLKELEDAEKLRYCWSDGGQCTLKALNDLPVSSFELDLSKNTNKGFN